MVSECNLKWATEQNWWPTFTRNYDPEYNCDIEASNIYEYIQEVRDRDLIATAFLWESSDEGHSYWMAINDEYCELFGCY